MRVLIFGAAGFLGSRLARALADSGRLQGRAITELVLCDARAVPPPPHPACRVSTLQGDLRDEALLAALFAEPAEVVFHLAAALTLDAEMDFRQGLEVNVLALIALLERCRAQAQAPVVVFASSISTFGGALPQVVDDFVHQAPRTSYGVHKVIAEQLLNDYARRGFVDGRALRLPIVLTHPGPPSGSISDQVAALIREPLRGQPVVCRFGRDSRMAVASVDKVVASFIHLAELPADALEGERVMNLPGLTVTPGQIAEAVRQRLPAGAPELVDWQADPQVQEIVDGWPRVFVSARAQRLGIRADASVDAVVDAYCASLPERNA